MHRRSLTARLRRLGFIQVNWSAELFWREVVHEHEGHEYKTRLTVKIYKRQANDWHVESIHFTGESLLTSDNHKVLDILNLIKEYE